MTVKEVPIHPAYLVFHDAFDKGAMDIWPFTDLASAQTIATQRQERLEQSGDEEAGTWKAYEKLPRVRVYKFHAGI